MASSRQVDRHYPCPCKISLLSLDSDVFRYPALASPNNFFTIIIFPTASAK